MQREAYLGELSSLAELKRGFGDQPLIDLLIEAAILHTTANLRGTELAEERADRMSARTDGLADVDERATEAEA